MSQNEDDDWGAFGDFENAEQEDAQIDENQWADGFGTFEEKQEDSNDAKDKQSKNSIGNQEPELINEIDKELAEYIEEPSDDVVNKSGKESS